MHTHTHRSHLWPEDIVIIDALRPREARRWPQELLPPAVAHVPPSRQPRLHRGSREKAERGGPLEPRSPGWPAGMAMQGRGGGTIGAPVSGVASGYCHARQGGHMVSDAMQGRAGAWLLMPCQASHTFCSAASGVLKEMSDNLPAIRNCSLVSGRYHAISAHGQLCKSKIFLLLRGKERRGRQGR
jgi:hypothetical protein